MLCLQKLKTFSPASFKEWEKKCISICESQGCCQMLMHGTGVYSQPYCNDIKVNEERFGMDSLTEWLVQHSHEHLFH